MGGEHDCAVAKLQVSEVSSEQQGSGVTFEFMPLPVPPVGFEPTLTAPEAVALSPELRGLGTPQGYQPWRSIGPSADGAMGTHGYLILTGSREITRERLWRAGEGRRLASCR